MVVKLSLYTKNVPAKIAFARNIVAKMTGHAFFQLPSPSLAEVAAAIDALEAAAIAAADGGKSKTALRNQLERELDDLLRRLAHWVANRAGQDEALILSTGMDIRQRPAPLSIPTMPDHLRTTLPGGHGIVTLSWKPVRGAYAYELQFREGDEGPWSKVVTVTRTNHKAEGLQSGQVYWWRVSAIGASGQSPWSDPAMVYAP